MGATKFILGTIIEVGVVYLQTGNGSLPVGGRGNASNCYDAAEIFTHFARSAHGIAWSQTDSPWLIIIILYTSYISRKLEKVGFTKFSFSQTGMWASFPDVLSLIFTVFPPRNIRPIQ